MWEYCDYPNDWDDFSSWSISDEEMLDYQHYYLEAMSAESLGNIEIHEGNLRDFMSFLHNETPQTIQMTQDDFLDTMLWIRRLP